LRFAGGTIGDDATRDSSARADLASELDELLSRRVASEFCVQTVAGVVVGELSGYRELPLCDEFGLDGGLDEANGSLKYMSTRGGVDCLVTQVTFVLSLPFAEGPSEVRAVLQG
jgi:hypothetical protein